MGKGIAASKIVQHLWLAGEHRPSMSKPVFVFLSLSLSLSLPTLDMSDGLQLYRYILIACLKRSLSKKTSDMLGFKRLPTNWAVKPHPFLR